jgi:2-methylisocitrate lyase-like PEP mutase family enzyme
MTANRQLEQATALRALHVPGDPLVLVNVWDAGSARVVAEAGAPALATSSWSVARARGWDDGEQTPLDEVVALVRTLTSTFALPVTVDLESGYGAAPEAVRTTVGRAVEAGAAGFNLEDSRPGLDALLPATEQAVRLAAARAATEEAGVPAFVNARTDVFLREPGAGPSGLEEVLARATQYAQAGADGLFVPGLSDLGLISKLVDGSPLPVNIMVDGEQDLGKLAAAGVARISFGASSYLAAMSVLGELGQFESSRARR